MGFKIKTYTPSTTMKKKDITTALQNMTKFGDYFVRHLAKLYLIANKHDKERLLKSMRFYFFEYSKF